MNTFLLIGIILFISWISLLVFSWGVGKMLAGTYGHSRRTTWKSFVELNTVVILFVLTCICKLFRR